MTIIKQYQVRTVDALQIGIQPERTGDAAVQANNSQRLQHYASAGYSVYFPEGEYEFSSAINWSNTTTVKVFGDNARIYQTSNGVRLFDFRNVLNLEVSGLHMFTNFFDTRVATEQGSKETPVFIQQCQFVDVRNNRFEGYNCFALHVLGGHEIKIMENDFRDGHWTANLEDTADIKLGRIDTEMPAEVIIAGNNCNSNSLVGISSLHPIKNVNCYGNNVISKDENGNELTTYSATLRKAGIELQYWTTPNRGNDNADSSQYKFSVHNNIVQGVRFTGIGGQSDIETADNAGGIRGSITGNTLTHVGLEQATGITDYVVGGILFKQYRDITVANNVINRIPADVSTTSGFGSMAICLRQDNERAINPGGALGGATVTGNVITNCASRGLFMEDNGDTVITGNNFRDVEGQNIRLYIPGSSAHVRPGKVVITGNKMSTEKQVSDNFVRIQDDNDTADFIYSGNQIDAGAGSYATTRAMLRAEGDKFTITNNRFKGPPTETRYAIRLETDKVGRKDGCVIGNNTFEQVTHAYIGNVVAGKGPFIVNNDSYSNVGAIVEAATRPFIYPGKWIISSDYTATQAVVHATAPPTEGNWLVGDIVENSAATPGGIARWVCTVAGNPGTWEPVRLAQAYGQITNSAGTQPQALTTTPVAINCFDSQFSSPNVTATPAAATIQIPDVTSATDDLYRLSMGLTLTPGANNVQYSIQTTLNGAPVNAPIVLDGRQSGTSLSFGTSVLNEVPVGAAPVIGLTIAMVAGTDTINWTAATFTVERVT